MRPFISLRRPLERAWHSFERQWRSLEPRSPLLFVVAGVLLAGYAALNGIAAATDMAFGALEDVVGPAGFVVGFAGLAGVYPRVADRRPRWATLGLCGAIVGGVAFGLIVLEGVLGVAGITTPNWTGAFTLLVIIGLIPGYLSMGVASLRSALPTPTAVLLLAPAIIFAAMLVQAVLFVQFSLFSPSTLQWSAVAISSGQSLAHLGLGKTLARGHDNTDRVESPTGAAAG